MRYRSLESMIRQVLENKQEEAPQPKMEISPADLEMIRDHHRKMQIQNKIIDNA
jgi:flagellar biosynthesis/type III secretory pathway protein FliH